MLGDFTHIRACKPFCEKYLTLPINFLIFMLLLVQMGNQMLTSEDFSGLEYL